MRHFHAYNPTPTGGPPMESAPPSSKLPEPLDALILGGGPAGLAAGVYLGRYLRPTPPPPPGPPAAPPGGGPPAGLPAGFSLGRSPPPPPTPDKKKPRPRWHRPTANNTLGFPAGIHRNQLIDWGRTHIAKYDKVH